MAHLTYEVVEHDGGWAYRVGGTISETFPTHDAARRAAERAAGEQRVSGEDAPIDYENERGEWVEELAPGTDRPETDVTG
jgi:hypothetical protein